jgi:hypothetical protein
MGKVFPLQLLLLQYLIWSRNPQSSLSFPCRQGLSTPLMLSSISHWTDKCTYHRLCGGRTRLLLETTAGAPGLVLDLLFSASASIFPAALRSRCTVHHLLCWDDSPPTDLTCSRLSSTCIAPRLQSAVEDLPLHGSVRPQHPFLHHYIPYICNLSATHILQWVTWSCCHRQSCLEKLRDSTDVTKRPCFEMVGHFLLTLFLQLKTSIQQEILLRTWYCVKYKCKMACLREFEYHKTTDMSRQKVKYKTD